MTLRYHTRGSGPRLVLVHGFTQNRRCWGDVADALAEHHELVMVDAPGHGESRHDRADLWEAGRLLAEVGREASYVGYSMGGRMALHTALQFPRLVTSLVLIGATPGIVDPDERLARRRADDALADRLDDLGLPAFLDQWLAQPLFAGLTDEQQHRAERLTNRPEGLADSLRSCGTGTQDDLWPRLPILRAPLLLVTGADDAKFGAVADRVAEVAGQQAQRCSVPGAGHAVHLEAPRAVADAITEFVSTTTAGRAG